MAQHKKSYFAIHLAACRGWRFLAREWLKVSLEPGKDYMLHYNQLPGGYSLTEGRPEI